MLATGMEQGMEVSYARLEGLRGWASPDGLRGSRGLCG
jgi:hypothetical protein